MNGILSGYEKEYKVKDISESLNGRFSLLLEIIAFDSKTIYIIGANFLSEKRGLVDYIIEKLT